MLPKTSWGYFPKSGRNEILPSFKQITLSNGMDNPPRRGHCKQMTFPNDDNGDALRRMEAEGDDLAQLRNIEFTVVFPDESSAKQFAEYFHGKSYAASVDFGQTVTELPWDVIVVKNMRPSHQGITEFETELQEVADSFGGRNDGWGCFSEPGGRLH
jgi:hypothetical protein